MPDSLLINTAVIQIANTACGALLPTAKSFVPNSTVVPKGPLLYLFMWGVGGEVDPTRRYSSPRRCRNVQYGVSSKYERFYKRLCL